MIELFPNVPGYIRDLAKNWVDLALQQPNPFEGVKMVSNFANSCQTEEEKEFVDFYHLNLVHKMKYLIFLQIILLNLILSFYHYLQYFFFHLI